MNNNKSKKRIILLSIIGSILVVLVAIGFSFAAFRARVNRVKETGAGADSIVINPGECSDLTTLNFENMIPGNQYTKEFSIVNPNTDRSMKVNIFMGDIVNEFYSDLDDLVYTLKDKDTGEILVPETIVPESSRDKRYLYLGLVIPASTTKEFQFIVNYKYLENIDQSAFKGSVFSAGFCADTELFKENDCDGECPEPGDVIGNDTEPEGVTYPICPATSENATLINNDCDATINVVAAVSGNKYYTNNVTNPYCKQSSSVPSTTCDETKRSYGAEIKIHHDIYFADSNKYSQGKNERYAVYCTPFKDGSTEGVMYCTKSNHKGNCKIVNRKKCSYETAIKDLGYSSTKKQKFVQNFMDTGWNEGGTVTNNWHVQTFCKTASKKTKYDSGVYYCNNNATVLHDWYSNSESTTNSISNGCGSSQGQQSSETDWNTILYTSDVGTVTLDPMDKVREGYYTFVAHKGTTKQQVRMRGAKAVCIYMDGEISCFGFENFETEKIRMRKVFENGTCVEAVGQSPLELKCTKGLYTCILQGWGNKLSVDCDAPYDQDCNIDEGMAWWEWEEGTNPTDDNIYFSTSQVCHENPCIEGTYRFAYGDPTSSSPTTVPNGKKVFGFYDTSSFRSVTKNRKGVCILSGSSMNCFRIGGGDNAEYERVHMRNTFTTLGGTCTEEDYDPNNPDGPDAWQDFRITCDTSDLQCVYIGDGNVTCTDKQTSNSCSGSNNDNGTVTCS